MEYLTHWLAPRLPLMFLTVTGLLAIGCGCLLAERSPAHRQRIAELTIGAILGWIVLAFAPLPRWAPIGNGDRGSADMRTESLPAPPQAAPAVTGNLRDLPPRPTAAAATSGKFAGDFTLGSSSVAELPMLGGPSTVDPRTAILADLASRPRPGQAPPRPFNRPAKLRGASLAQASWKDDLLHRFAEFYLLAAVLACGWLACGHLLLLRERFAGSRPPIWLLRLMHSLHADWQGRYPRLIVSPRCARPLSWGLWRPLILLPEAICRVEQRATLRAILLHELGHIRRHDARGNLLFEIAFPLLAIHPLYGWLRGQSRMAAELLADDWAAANTGKELYVDELVALAKTLARRTLPIVAATSVFSSTSQFYRRMQMLLAREKPIVSAPSRFWRLVSLLLVLAAMASAVSLVGTGPASGDQAGATSNADPTAPHSETPPAVSNSTSSPAANPNLPKTPAATPQPGISGSISNPAATSGAAAPPAALQDPPIVGQSYATTPAEGGTSPAAAGPAVAPFGSTAAPNPAAPAADAERLQERAMLTAQIHALTQQLERLQSQNKSAGNAVVTPIAQGQRVILEVLDPDGSRRLSTYQLAPDGQHPLVESRPAANAPEYIVRGASLNNQTGSASVTPPIQNPNAPAAKPGADYSIAAGPTPISGAGPLPAYHAAPATDSADITATRSVDLIALATAYADAVAAVDVAKAKLIDAEASQAKSAGSLLAPIHALSAELDAARRKELLLQQIAKLLAEKATERFERLSKLYKAGAVATQELDEAQSRSDILRQIVNSGYALPKQGTNNPQKK